jgi:tetratricopeptide (TPR) repeat protein
MKPRIFISAVTKELRSARQLVANTLVALGYEPVWQDIFDTRGDDIRAMLRNKIDSCSAVLQIVGDAYGVEPPTNDEKFGRVSYTQYEALYARSIDKKVYYLIASRDLARDAGPDMFDQPLDDSDAARADSDQRRLLQRNYRTAVQSTGHIYYAIQSHPETELAVRRLKDELDKLRRGFRSWMVGVSAALVLIALGIGWLSGSMLDLFRSVEEGQKKTEEQIIASGQKTKEELTSVIKSAVKELTNPSVLAERIRKEIQATSEVKIDALPDAQGRGRKIVEIEKERDLALGRVDDLIKLIQEGLKEGASPVFQRAADILQKEGIDEALTYLESRRESTWDDARRHADQAKTAEARAESERELRNKSLQALVLEADLLESKLQWEAALKMREQVAELAPDWFEARSQLGLIQLDLARFHDAEPNLRVALKLADTTKNEAIALNNLSLLLQATNRLAEAEPLLRRTLTLFERSNGTEYPEVALLLNNLAQLLQTTNRLAEAEPLMRRALAIDEASYGSEHPHVAGDISNLAQLLQDTNRLAEAEPLMRRALAIKEQSYGSEHPHVAGDISNLAQLLQTTNRLAEAEPLMRRALAIKELSYGSEHPDVAKSLNNLAHLLVATNGLAEAEPLMRRALSINERSYGSDHPIVANSLNNLAQLLLTTNRLADAEPIFRRALAIDEQSYGSEHPDVAIRLTNLAALLQAMNLLAEAEPLMRRSLAIFETSFGVNHPKVAVALNHLARLLHNTNRLAEAEPLMRRALTIDEQSYGAEHPDVARDLTNLAGLLEATKRHEVAELLMRQCITILHLFGREVGYDHPRMQIEQDNYRGLLLELKIPDDEIVQRLQNVTMNVGPLEPVGPQLERLLGSAKPVEEVLADLESQYKRDGKPAIYFLKATEPISPFLHELLQPTAPTMNLAGVTASDQGRFAEAILFYEEALRLQGEQPVDKRLNLAIRLNRAIGYLELGVPEHARDDLRLVLSEIDQDSASPALEKGLARFHLALSEWQLGDRIAAKREAEESLVIFGADAEFAAEKEQSEQLLTDLNDDKTPPPMTILDSKLELSHAKSVFLARAELSSLSLKESALPFMDKILGQAKSTKEVLDYLDQEYRNANKPEVWFLPLGEPIAPHLDQLLGPLNTLTTSDRN